MDACSPLIRFHRVASPPFGLLARSLTISIASLFVAAFVLAGDAPAQTITLDDDPLTDAVTTFTYDGLAGAVSDARNPTSLPFVDTSLSVDGLALSQSLIDLSNAGLGFDFTLARATGVGSFAQLVTAVRFRSDADVDFVASGELTANDVDGRRVLYFASLYDVNTATQVFQHFQESRVTPDETFTLGFAEGDFGNGAVGELAGTLAAGHLYLLQLNILVETNGAPTATGASATGRFDLDFHPIGATPIDADRFLTFLNAVSDEHAEDVNSALAYYATIDPFEDRTTLEAWRLMNGFDTGATASAVYVNEADLGFGRRMFVKTHPNGRVASYVVNHGDDTMPTPADPTADPVDGPADEKIDNVHAGVNIIATVAMEYGPPAEDPSGEFFTKFYAYAPDGARIEQADLDGRGAKSIPGVCNVCHGGYPRPVLSDGRYPGRGDTGAGFLPWDLDAFGYSGTLYGGFPIYDRASQESDFKALNEAVLATNPNAATREVIEGWYGGPGLPNATFDGEAVPVGWAGHEAAYREIYAPNCRACHIMRSPALAFRSYAEFTALRESANSLVFDRSIMPLARRTYDRFWASLPGSGDPAAVDLFGLVPASRRPGSESPLPFAGPDDSGATGLPSQLDARDSSYATSFAWNPISVPAGSTATLDDPTSPTPIIVPDLAGAYAFEVTATNAAGSSTDLVTLTATSDGSDPGVDFETDVFPIFETRCESCHDGTSAPDFLDGASAYSARLQKTFQNFVSRANVMDAPESLLLQKAGGSLGHGGGAPLSDPTEATTVLRWIEEGAKRSTRAATYRRVGVVLPVTIMTMGGVVHPYDGIDLAPNALLNGERLFQANLLGADLDGASAVGTDFSGAVLVIADLSGADLSGADLSGADLGFANVTGTNFAGVTYDETTVFPSGDTFDVGSWGLGGGVSPWNAGMIPVPEPGFGASFLIAAVGLARFVARGRATSDR